MVSRSVLAVAFLALFAVAFASEFESPDVAHLTSSNYDDAVSDGKVYFIKFYAPWCGHCKRLAATWKDLGAAYKGSDKVVIGHVDCTVSRDVCTSAEIKGYPTLKVFHKGEEYKPYRGTRDLESLKKFVEDAAEALLTESA